MKVVSIIRRMWVQFEAYIPLVGHEKELIPVPMTSNGLREVTPPGRKSARRNVNIYI